MIPKRAFFLWVGNEPLPWLRQMSVDSFRSQNPDWKVELIRVPAAATMLAAQATDIFRYNELAERGGLYLDTDIVFFRPVPEEMLDCELAVTIDKSPLCYSTGNASHRPETEYMPGFTNLAFMGCSPGNTFFREVYQKALDRYQALVDDHVDIKRQMYQAFGTSMLNRIFFGKTEEELASAYGPLYNVPLDLVLPIRWFETHRLFNGTAFEPPEGCIGVHWYGGCVDAKIYCKQHNAGNFHRRPCYLTEAIHESLQHA